MENGNKPKAMVNEKYFHKRDGTKYIREDVAKEIYTPTKRMQFSQKICIFSCVFIVAIWLGNFTLAWFDKPQIPEAISVGFTIFGGFVTGGYFALSGVRDCSRNRHAKELREAESIKSPREDFII